MLNGNGIDRRGSERTNHDPLAQALESTRATVKNGNELRAFGCIALKRVINPEADGVGFHCFGTGGKDQSALFNTNGKSGRCNQLACIFSPQ
jgi:hypothetical protein